MRGAGGGGGGGGRGCFVHSKDGGNRKQKVVVSRMDTLKHGWTAHDVYSTEN